MSMAAVHASSACSTQSHSQPCMPPLCTQQVSNSFELCCGAGGTGGDPDQLRSIPVLLPSEPGEQQVFCNICIAACA